MNDLWRHGGEHVGHPGAVVEAVDPVADIDGLFYVVARDGAGVWGGWVLVADGRVVSERGLDAGARALRHVREGAVAPSVVALLGAVGALPPGFEVSDGWVVDGNSGLGASWSADPVRLVLYAHPDDVKRRLRAGTLRAEIGKAYTRTRWIRATLTLDDGALRWEVD